MTPATRELDADLAAGPVHYADFGGAGTPMLLVHGLGGSRLNWLAVGPRLAERHRVYAIDLIGHGKTPLAGRRATLPSHRRLIDTFLQQVVGEPAIIVGNSTGGHLAIMEAAAEPDRVRALVLVDPAVPIPVGSAAVPPAVALAVAPLLIKGLGEALMLAESRRMTSEQVVYRTLKLVSGDGAIPEELVRAHLEAHLARHGNAEANSAFLQTGRSLLMHNLRRRRFYERARQVRAPVLVIQGEKDRLVPMAAIKRLLKARPDWDSHVFPGLGHVPMMEAPPAFCEVLERWLAERSLVAA